MRLYLLKSINFQKNIGTVKRKATVYFTELAYRKFQALVDGFNNEVAWHGLAYRGEDESKDEYYITDILVYPQEVTGATVTTDQKKYQDWLMSQEDNIFNNVRMQGHSHVNMGVSPSGVDENLYESILTQLDETQPMPNKKVAFLYKFNPESYNEMKEKGFRLEF